MMDLPAGLDVLSLERPTNGTIPKQRLSDPNKACQIVATLIYANQDRSALEAKVKGMLDGNAPFSYSELRRQGQTGRTNINFREGEAMMGDAMTPFYDLFAESKTYCEIEVNEQNSQKRIEWSRIITKEFDYLAKEWSGFDWNIQAILYDMVAYGKGFAFFPNKTTWQFRSIRQSRVLVPDQTSSDIEQMELIVIRQACPVHELYASIRDPKAASTLGWKRNAVLDAIKRAMPKSATDDAPLDYELLQQELRNHDLYLSTQSNVVKIAHILVREFNNKISHLIVEERSAAQVPYGQAGNVLNAQFLFKKIGRYESFRQALCPVFYDIGDGTFHSIKGLAIKLHPFIEIKNRLNCSVVDNAFINMSVLVRPLTANAQQNAAIMQLGPLSVLPQNMEIQQWGLTGRMEEGLAVEAALTRKLESNLGQYRKPMFKEQGNPATATQVTYDAAKEAALGKGAVNRFYVQMDMLFEEMYRRASSPNLTDDGNGPNSKALEFQQRCMDQGVPKAKLMKPRWVRATRNIGNGSIFLRQQTIMSTAQLVPMMNEAGRQNWLDSAIAVMAGTENVESWNPKMQLPDRLVDEQAYAVLENNALLSGAPVLWTPTQNNAVHFVMHMKASVDALNSLANGGNPPQVLAFLDAAGQHMSQHLQQMQRDPMQAQAFRVSSAQFKELQRNADILRQQLSRMAQQQQQNAMRQQQMMSAQQLDQWEVNNKIRMQQQKTDAALEMKREKHNQGLVLADASTAADVSRKNMQVAADTAIKARSSQETNGAE